MTVVSFDLVTRAKHLSFLFQARGILASRRLRAFAPACDPALNRDPWIVAALVSVRLGKHNYLVKYKTGEVAKRLGNAPVAPVIAYVPEGEILAMQVEDGARQIQELRVSSRR